MNSNTLLIATTFIGLTFFIGGCSKSEDKASNTKSPVTNTSHDHDHAGHDAHATDNYGKDADTVSSDAYPLTTCVISGEKLGSHGKPFDLVIQGRTVRLCCESCVDEVKADPAVVFSKIDHAKKTQK